MEKTVYKKKADARWKGNGFGYYRCSLCWTVVAGHYHLTCPGCGAQMFEEGDFIYNEETGEAGIVKLGETAL